MTLFLVWHEAERKIEPEALFALDYCELRPGLLLIDSALSTSRLYHQLKWSMPGGSALLVSRLDGLPKFKLMEAGALSWIRSRVQPK